MPTARDIDHTGPRRHTSDETAEGSQCAPNKKKTAFKRKYQEYHLNYGFIATGDSDTQGSVCVA